MSWLTLLLAFTAAAVVFRVGVYALDKIARACDRARGACPSLHARPASSRSGTPASERARESGVLPASGSRPSLIDDWARIALGGSVSFDK